jgi:hypothetical protein
LPPENDHHALCREVIPPRFHTGIFNIFYELGVDKVLLRRRRREGLKLLDGGVVFVFFGFEFKDGCAVELLPDFVEGFCQLLFDPGFVLPGEFKRCVHLMLSEEGGCLRANAPDFFDGQRAEVAMELPARDDRQPRGLLPLRGNFCHDLRWGKAHGEGKTELRIELFFYALGNALI